MLHHALRRARLGDQRAQALEVLAVQRYAERESDPRYLTCMGEQTLP